MKLFLSALFFISYLAAGEEIDLAKLSQNEKIVIATKQIEFEEFPGAFNPSLIRVDEGFLLTFRFCPDVSFQSWINYIAVVLLNENLDPITDPQVLNTRPKKSKTPSQSEDARVFAYRNRMFLIYNDNVDVTGSSQCDRRDMFMAELLCENGSFKLSPALKLIHEEKYGSVLWQKNWEPFEWNNTLLLTYSLNPHEVIFPNFSSGTCYHCYETKAEFDWKYGNPRGSTPPILVDGEYLAFFHSALKTVSEVTHGQKMWHYFMGAYTFSPEPPFEITKMTSLPIIGEGFYTNSDLEKRVIFPGGCVVTDNAIYVAYGKDDCEIWIATLDPEALKKALVPVAQK